VAVIVKLGDELFLVPDMPLAVGSPTALQTKVRRQALTPIAK
jgi:hypothetical protein